METNPEWSSAVKQRFFQLESKSNLNVFNQWIRFRELSLHELKLLYERLGIHFDIFSSESMYSDSSYEMIKMLTEKGLIEKIDNALYANLTSHEDSNKNVKVPLLKSDGSTLYLTRDIAALMHRKKLYNFDRIFYVVDSSQSKHFNNLKSVFCSLDDPVHREIKHLKFGRIVGMSTRRGETIFLDDVLNEAKTRALESIASSPSKITIDWFSLIFFLLKIRKSTRKITIEPPMFSVFPPWSSTILPIGEWKNIDSIGTKLFDLPVIQASLCSIHMLDSASETILTPYRSMLS